MRIIDWTAELEGDAETLKHLADILPSGPVRVERDSAGVFALKLEHLRDSSDTLAVENVAAGVVRAGLGALNAFANIAGDVTIRRVYGVDQHGANIGAGPSVRMNLRITCAEGKQRLGSGALGPQVVELARQRPNVARALGLLANRDPSWADIYVLMELIEVALHAKSKKTGKDWLAIQGKAWIRSSDVQALKRNAAFHRHAKQFKPPSPAIPLWRAQVLCKAIVRGWLEESCAGAV